MSTITIAKPQVQIDEAVQQLLQVEEESCTIVHCRIFTEEPTMIRIWPQTFLVQDTGNRCKLIRAFNISMMPDWTYFPVKSGFIRFTLVFEGLDKQCRSFELLEDIQEPGAFYSNPIIRNNSDVYQAEVFTK